MAFSAEYEYQNIYVRNKIVPKLNAKQGGSEKQDMA
jgi:hypothetical protein